MNNSHFYLLTPRGAESLSAQADDLYVQLQECLKMHEAGHCALLQARFYVSDAANQCEWLRAHALVRGLETTGVVSFVEQPPLCGAKVAVLLWFIESDAPIVRRVEALPEGSLVSLEAGSLTYYMQCVRFGDAVEADDAGWQTHRAFELHRKQLSARGLNLADHCHRTWIYVRDVDRHYAAVVQARNEVFDKEGLTKDTHYIASTGIGGAGESRKALVAIDFFSVLGLSAGQVGYLQALDYLDPTHEYGVAFERGTYLDLPGGRHLFISGTASIDKHGQCVHRGDVLTQAGRLFLNIEKLLESGGAKLSDVRYFLVYLRDVADYAAVARYMRLRFPSVPCLITEARVCRPEWLVEVECVAVRTN